MGEEFQLNPSSKIWLDELVVLVRSKSKPELHGLLVDYRRLHVRLWPSTAEEFEEELEQKELHDMFLEMVACEEYVKREFQPTDTPVLRELSPEVLYGPVGFGAADELVDQYAAWYSDVYVECSYQGEDDDGLDEWMIAVYFRGKFVKAELNNVILNAPEILNSTY